MHLSVNLYLNSSYPKDFPSVIDINEEVDPLSCLSFAEAFQSAQNAHVPYYSLAIVQSGKEGEKFYHLYDTAYFTTYRVSKGPLKESLPPNLTDPLSGRVIQKIYYFAIKCFQPDGNNLYRPTDLKNDRAILLPFETENLPVELQTMLLDSTNGNIFETGRIENRQQVRRTQYIIADLIKKGGVFPRLTENERKNEIIEWLWCSSQDSYRGLVNLAKEYLRQHPSDSQAKMVALNLLNRIHPLPDKESLNAKEIQALVEGQSLFLKLKHEVASPKKGNNQSPKTNRKI